MGEPTDRERLDAVIRMTRERMRTGATPIVAIYNALVNLRARLDGPEKVPGWLTLHREYWKERLRTGGDPQSTSLATVKRMLETLPERSNKMKVTITCINGHEAIARKEGKSIFATCAVCGEEAEYRYVEMDAEGEKAPEIKVTVIIHGEKYEKLFQLRHTLRDVKEAAIQETSNSGRPVSEWFMTDSKGNHLDEDLRLDKCEAPLLAEGLWITLGVGHGA